MVFPLNPTIRRDDHLIDDGISNGRWNALSEKEKDKFAKICPDFVIERMSDTDEKYTLPAKMENYLQNGLRLGWLIDPFN